jgi:hypothetical protein
MQFGIYRKIVGHTGVGELYQFSHIVRHHKTGVELIEYIPLRIEPEWADTVRFCVLERDEFDKQFVFVSEKLPKDPADYHQPPRESMTDAVRSMVEKMKHPTDRERHEDGRLKGTSPLYVRQECPFQYCAAPDICKPMNKCRHDLVNRK